MEDRKEDHGSKWASDNYIHLHCVLLESIVNKFRFFILFSCSNKYGISFSFQPYARIYHRLSPVYAIDWYYSEMLQSESSLWRKVVLISNLTIQPITFTLLFLYLVHLNDSNHSTKIKCDRDVRACIRASFGVLWIYHHFLRTKKLPSFQKNDPEKSKKNNNKRYLSIPLSVSQWT